ncbi:MAG: response regulator transcription factor [Bacteroidales bacterium]|nr:response regulator transcription factor [Bacteroidales bacterium]
MKPEEKKIKILLVEDDLNLGFLLVDFLESSGYDVNLYRDGEAGLKGFHLSHFDFCILDIMLPRMDGFTLLERIKESDKKVPVMLLSARSLKDDKIKGFRLGIDDYLTKPFDEEELLYRIKAILNRTNLIPETKKELKTTMVGQYEFDQANQVLRFRDKCQRLTLKESNILGMLSGSINNIVKREEIMLNVWGDSDYYTGRSLDVFISKLRAYLKEDSSAKITTIPTVGYILDITE